MAYFEWADDMVIDNGQIDAEHRKLVDLVNELHTATSQGIGQSVVGDLLERLIADTAEHLRHEEMQMQQAGFPDQDNHRIGHEHFINDLRRLKEKLDAGSITVAAQLSSVLRDWLSLHIRRNDKELRFFLEGKRRSAQRAPKRR
ncbi:MAG: hemerythrin family protein [Comamonadaceae bacterium]|nr:hemerythrin family protein [Comamonadaceae bacterium]